MALRAVAAAGLLIFCPNLSARAWSNSCLSCSNPPSGCDIGPREGGWPLFRCAPLLVTVWAWIAPARKTRAPSVMMIFVFAISISPHPERGSVPHYRKLPVPGKCPNQEQRFVAAIFSGQQIFVAIEVAFEGQRAEFQVAGHGPSDAAAILTRVQIVIQNSSEQFGPRLVE